MDGQIEVLRTLDQIITLCWGCAVSIIVIVGYQIGDHAVRTIYRKLSAPSTIRPTINEDNQDNPYRSPSC